MKSALTSLAVVAILVFATDGLRAQGLDSIGGPYTVDGNTVLLLHYDSSYANAAAATGLTAAAAVPHATNPSKISWFPTSAKPGLKSCVRIDNSAITDSAFITIDDTAALDITGNWTIEAWANIFTFGSSSSDWRWVPRVVMKPGDDVFWHPNYWLEMWGDNRLFHGGYYTPSDAFISVTSPNNMFIPGEWVHLTFIRDTARSFIAVMVHDASLTLRGFLTRGFDKTKDIPKVNVQKLYMGWAGTPTDPSVDSYLDGFIDEVRISKVVRNFAGPPVVSSPTILANQPSTASSYPVSITAFPLNAGNSITSAVVKYRADTVGAFTSVTMSAGPNNTYTGSLPAQPFKTRIEYYYVITDNAAQKSLSPFDAEAATNPTRYSFRVFQPNTKVLDVTFEEGPSGTPVDHSTNQTTITRRPVLEYSTEVPAGGGTYSLLLQSHAGKVVDSNWVEASSPFLAVEEFTLDTWIKADSASLPFGRIIINPTSENDWNNANFELSFRPGSLGSPVYTARYWRNDGSGTVALQDTLVAATAHVGKWRHIIIERNKTGSQFGLAIKDENDVLIFKKTAVEPIPPLMAAAPLRIGRSAFVENDNWFIPPFRGKIDNVKLYNYPLGLATTGVGNSTANVPLAFELLQNFPNPFNPSTEIHFTIPKFDHVTLEVFDLLGRKVKTLVNEQRHAGSHTVTWNSINSANQHVASGMYFYRLRAGDLTSVKKMLLLK